MYFINLKTKTPTMLYTDLLKIEKVLKMNNISCFVDPNRWENKDGFVLYFHKNTHALKAAEYFKKEGIETYDILPNVLNAYFKWVLVIKSIEKLHELILREEDNVKRKKLDKGIQ